MLSYCGRERNDSGYRPVIKLINSGPRQVSSSAMVNFFNLPVLAFGMSLHSFISCVCSAAFIFAAVSASATPQTMIWPDFLTSPFFSVPPSGVPIDGLLYYSSGDKGVPAATRVEHGPGSYECAHFYHTNDACTLLFRTGSTPAQDQLYALFPNNTCCLDMQIGSTPKTWQNGATYVNTEMMNGFESNHFIKTHQFWNDVKSGLTTRFAFPENPQQDMWFNVTETRTTAIDVFRFLVPDYCSLPCSPNTTEFRHIVTQLSRPVH
jgi:hypothetical protein